MAGHSAVEGFQIVGALGIEAGKQDEERRRVDAAVVLAERHLMQGRHLAVAHFVQDLARLGVGSGIGLLRLVARPAGAARRARHWDRTTASACAVISPSRPNVVEYQGMPAYG